VNAARIAAAGLLAYGAWAYYKSQQEQAAAEEEAPTDEGGGDWLSTTDDVLTSATEGAAEFIDTWTGGILKISAMSKVSPLDLANPNVRAMLRVIRRGEGTADDNGYRRIFGGQLFSSFADHPRVTVKASGYTSSAAGAYQFITSSWDETKRVMGLPDFSPRSQDLAAIGRMAARGALEDVKAGRFETAVKKIAREWASLPGSPYGQPTISWDTARTVYAAAGGGDATYTA
jgi:muramidase (phage lysozyme)